MDAVFAAGVAVPDGVVPVAYLCLGYVTEFLDEPELQQAGWRARQPLAGAIHANRWGQLFYFDSSQ